VGDIVHVANLVKSGKLDCRCSKVKHVIILRKSENTFELVNTESGKHFIRNAKFLLKG
jgi:hypothetical protein